MVNYHFSGRRRPWVLTPEQPLLVHSVKRMAGRYAERVSLDHGKIFVVPSIRSVV